MDFRNLLLFHAGSKHYELQIKAYKRVLIDGRMHCQSSTQAVPFLPLPSTLPTHEGLSAKLPWFPLSPSLCTLIEFCLSDQLPLDKFLELWNDLRGSSCSLCFISLSFCTFLFPNLYLSLSRSSYLTM